MLIVNGQVQSDELRTAGLTASDLYRMLRRAGESDLSVLRYVLYEAQGGISVVRTDQPCGEPVRVGLAEAGSDELR